MREGEIERGGRGERRGREVTRERFIVSTAKRTKEAISSIQLQRMQNIASRWLSNGRSFLH